MTPEAVEELRQRFTDQYVVVDAARPDLARFQQMVGQVKTVNMNGRALVQFDGQANRGWYDIALDFLTVVEKPAPKPEKEAPPRAAGAKAAKPAKEEKKGE